MSAKVPSGDHDRAGLRKTASLIDRPAGIGRQFQRRSAGLARKMRPNNELEVIFVSMKRKNL
jgi:hypothetical protein